MKKLLINGLLIFVFILLALALFSALMNLRATDKTDAAIDSLADKQQNVLVQEKAIVEQTSVTVSVSNASNSSNATKTTNTSSKSSSNTSQTTKKTTSSDSDVNSFLNSVD